VTQRCQDLCQRGSSSRRDRRRPFGYYQILLGSAQKGADGSQVSFERVVGCPIVAWLGCTIADAPCRALNPHAHLSTTELRPNLSAAIHAAMPSQVRVRCLLGHPPKLTIIEIVVSGRKPNLRQHATGLRDGPIDR